ncbi:aldo/keto reductase [Roseiarcaceae bacterium H3SJ34-1]|uniref:aldo/keto reductase n=1 Tax=Terripilifer ovatus TaxID=3032367 RepID=UPI003AB95ED6|nr:aldo/keto reductase [Roseiarcaceae bacterium H3SJ34-1]
MQQRRFGSGLHDVSIIGQGTWKIDESNRAAAVAALRRGIDDGMTHIDTAEMYGDAELVIADAMKGQRRDALFLVSKVLPQNASRTGVIAACERSLARLGTDYLDCYLLHWRGRHPLAATIEGFEDLVRAGRIRSWGVSNFDVADLDEALAIAGPGRIACNQVLYHLRERSIEHAVLPWCEHNGVAVVAYTPFGPGAFPAANTPGGRLLAEIATAHDATARQVALAWLARRSFVIPKASSAAHAAQNAGAGDLDLSDDAVKRIDEAFPRGAKPRGLPML